MDISIGDRYYEALKEALQGYAFNKATSLRDAYETAINAADDALEQIEGEIRSGH